ncbi:choice-of-anchor I family protein [Paraglaciecola aquimarina]|uniref:Choice-of-anchor I family protein n=1 Tax=Paraglaciecola aquimarina TaxID=1235557 RepID=A0ABU3SRM9_9ALTE|nr:choice-of-anchor I family protein [Paraglaciecola aquimarina]MDU0352669.1 choice-of-anchor I family protein [Paraglaciecola aquimarina]
MTKFNFYRKTAIALAISLSITGCALEGDDGQDGIAGANGQDGAQGPSGADGQDANAGISLSIVGRIQLNPSDPEGAAEIVQYHAATNTIYAINSAADDPTVEIIDASNISQEAILDPLTADNLTTTALILPTDISGVDLDGPTSISVSGDLMAIAVPAEDKASNGYVLFYDGVNSTTPTFVKAVEVGNLPDMVTFTPDGSKVLTANEGEPSGDYSIDPEGSVSVITITDGTPADSATAISFAAYNGKQVELEAQGMHFPNPSGRTINGNLIDTTVAQDLEPEYITTTDQMAYITLQENNGLAIVNLTDNSVKIIGLGYKDWSNYQIDSMEDGAVSFGQYQDLYGLYMPDTIASFQWKDANFLVTANEGDAREYFFDTLNADGEQDEDLCEAAGGQDFDEDDGCLSYTDETQARKLDYAAGSNLAAIAGDDPEDFDFTAYPLGRLTVTSELGDTDDDGEYESLYAYGARSFTIWDNNGLVVFDSGDDFERITASIHGDLFNNNNDENEGDARSSNKGPEPEALTVGKVGDKTYAFIGLERMGGIFVYDITNPYDSQFVDYVINRDITEGGDIIGDSAPEGMAFVSAENSPTGVALLVVGNEVSGTVSVWQVTEK